MKLVSWNCRGGFHNKYQKLISMSPDIAVIQDCLHPSKLEGVFDYHDAVWVGKKENKGLSVFSFSTDYKLSILVDEVKYEWVVPIRVSGAAEFVLLAVWARRMPGYTYGKLVYAALKEYEQFFNDAQVVIIGDFNVDKNVPSSYSGIQGRQGFDRLIDLLDGYRLKSCYHHFSQEDFGSERTANYYHFGKSDDPFHVHYCFVSDEMLQDVKHFYIEEDKEWTELSYHLPLVLEIANPLDNQAATRTVEKIDITPEILKEKYNLIINNEPATPEEIDEAIKFIKALRIMNEEEQKN